MAGICQQGQGSGQDTVDRLNGNKDHIEHDGQRKRAIMRVEMLRMAVPVAVIVVAVHFLLSVY